MVDSILLQSAVASLSVGMPLVGQARQELVLPLPLVPVLLPVLLRAAFATPPSLGSWRHLCRTLKSVCLQAQLHREEEEEEEEERARLPRRTAPTSATPLR